MRRCAVNSTAQARPVGRRRRPPGGHRQLPQGFAPNRRTRARRAVPPGTPKRGRGRRSRQLAQAVDEHAAAIAAARDLIPAETDLAQWLSTARPNAVEAWQQLPGHLAAVDRVGRIAASFGARPSARFPLFVEQGYTDNRLVSDVALFCVAGPNLAVDSAPFLRLGPTAHRASPWFAVGPLRLNSVEQARIRYESWCAGEWDKTHANTTVQFTKPDGTVGEMELTNPHRAKAVAR